MEVSEAARLVKFARTAMLHRSKATDQGSAEYQANALMEEAKAWALLLDGVPFREAQDALIRVLKAWTSAMFGYPKPGDVLAEVRVMRRERQRFAWADGELADALEDDPGLDVDAWWLKLSRDNSVSQMTRDYALTKTKGGLRAIGQG